MLAGVCTMTKLLPCDYGINSATSKLARILDMERELWDKTYSNKYVQFQIHYMYVRCYLLNIDVHVLAALLRKTKRNMIKRAVETSKWEFDDQSGVDSTIVCKPRFLRSGIAAIFTTNAVHPVN